MKKYIAKFLYSLTMIISFSFAQGANEIPLEALMGDQASFFAWRNNFSVWYRGRIDSTGDFLPSAHKIIQSDRVDGITIQTINFVMPSTSLLNGGVAGGILAVPDGATRTTPIIVAIHGHEESPWGGYPKSLFKKNKWAYELAKAGYLVWAPISMYHDEISSIAEIHGYTPTWVKIISDGVNYGANNLWAGHPHDLIITGLSSGAEIAYSLMAYREDVSLGVFAGAGANLDFLRREYRIKGHPICGGMNGITSFLEILALLPPRPIQIQLGKADPFFPNSRPMAKQAPYFEGTKRGQLSVEVAQDPMALKLIYDSYGKRSNFSYLIHNGGHDFIALDALQFIQKNYWQHE